MYQRKLLRINLSNWTSKVEEINPEYIRDYVGGRGLGARLLYDELPPHVDPLGEDNKLMFVLGPLQGTKAPGQSRYCVVTKSPQTNIYNMSLGASDFGPAVARTGFMVIIIEGKSENPIWLRIDESNVRFEDAKTLWGVSTEGTHDMIWNNIGRKYEIACIGPAGENGVLYSAIITDRRAAARGGVGAVMGSKNLKAIAIRGNKKPPIEDEKFFTQTVKKAHHTVNTDPRTSGMLRMMGSNHMSETTNAIGGLPTRNWKHGHFENFKKIGTRTYVEDYVAEVRNICDPCTVKCAKFTKANEGEYKGIITDGPEYETTYAFGSNLENDCFSSIITANKYCDEMGLDTMSTGTSISFAIECFEKGYLTKEDTDGIELKWGDHKTYMELIHKIAHKEGFGAFLALGSMRMAKEIGKDSADFAMHAKGMEMGGYDPRAIKGMALTYACGNRGGCHHAGGHSIFAEVFSDKWDRFADENKGALVKAVREKRVVSDSAIICTFNTAGQPLDEIADLLKGATGYDYDEPGIRVVADRINIVERAFNVREGIRRKHDTLARRLTHEPMPDGPSKGSVVNLDVLLDDFYKACGYDLETGIPTEEKMRSLNMEEHIIDDMKNIDADASGPWPVFVK